eukprot:TRINITY_DN8908_c0_g1_i2.p1 TRINITY_DN8908_c0_g1~~TRINITY_DN8908_c0_g1_i2.p1  ORF type:complete len:191 (+),score=25.10 TRINITY_DN8908_c0_g1_i2:26-574(+)
MGTQKLHIYYVVSGEGEDHLWFTVFQEARFDPENQNKKWATKPKYFVTGKRDFEQKITVTEDQEFRICFRCEDGKQKTLSFDFVLDDQVHNEGKDQRALALQSLKKNQRKLQKIFQNQHYQTIRDSTHSKKISQMIEKIKWCSVLKIVVLTLLCGLQIYLLTSVFSKKVYSNIKPETMMTMN